MTKARRCVRLCSGRIRVILDAVTNSEHEPTDPPPDAPDDPHTDPPDDPPDERPLHDSSRP
jgi:hypothetical protein